MNEMTLKGLIEKYISYRRASDKKQRPEIDLLQFYNVCSRTFERQSYLSQEMIDWWWTKRDSESAITHQSRIYKVKPFLDYVINMQRLVDLTIPPMPPHVIGNTIPHYFTEEELTKFYMACDEIVHCKTLQQKLRKVEVPVIFRLLYSSGMRCIEARLLDRNNVNLESGVIQIVNSKGYRERVIVVHQSMLEILKRYDCSIDLLMPSRKVFFPDIYGNYRKDKWLNDQFRQCWYKYNDSEAYPRELRHQYAIENINSWPNRNYETNEELVALKNSMGHSKVSRTLSYYALVPKFGEIIESKCGDTLEEVLPKMP